MKIAVASGKGGTGKTTIAVNLALAASAKGEKVDFYDCDVEAPNAGLFLNPDLTAQEDAVVLIPEINPGRCTLCGRCVEVCVYNAMALVGEEVLVFPSMCHGCGSCTNNCPEGAITEVPHRIGVIDSGTAGDIQFHQGRMDIGEAMATPIIHAMKAGITVGEDKLVLLDAPPGTACPVVETVRGMDYVLMVTEPTPFGFHDLRQAVKLVKGELGIPVGVVLNRDGIGNNQVAEYCAEYEIPILMRIPFDRTIAEVYSEGRTLVEALPEYMLQFEELFNTLIEQVTV